MRRILWEKDARYSDDIGDNKICFCGPSSIDGTFAFIVEGDILNGEKIEIILEKDDLDDILIEIRGSLNEKE